MHIFTFAFCLRCALVAGTLAPDSHAQLQLYTARGQAFTASTGPRISFACTFVPLHTNTQPKTTQSSLANERRAGRLLAQTAEKDSASFQNVSHKGRPTSSFTENVTHLQVLVAPNCLAVQDVGHEQQEAQLLGFQFRQLQLLFRRGAGAVLDKALLIRQLPYLQPARSAVWDPEEKFFQMITPCPMKALVRQLPYLRQERLQNLTEFANR